MSGGRVATLGECLGLLRTREPGTLAQLGTLAVGFGGAEGNVAIGLARLGTDVSWLGRVGDDGLGRRIVRELRGEGIDVHAVVDLAAPTALMLKESPVSGATTVTYHRAGGAGSRLEPDDVESLDIPSAALLHVTGITLALSASARAAVLRAVDIAAEAGVPVSFDVNHRSRLWDADAAAPHYRSIAERATILFAGDDEARLLLGGDLEDPAQLIDGMAGLGPAEVLLKLGPDGCRARIDGEDLTQPAVRIDPVDTVGAGDAFVAGYLAERIAGRPPAERLRTAVRTAAFACLNPGDWEGLPRRVDLRLLDGGDPVAR